MTIIVHTPAKWSIIRNIRCKWCKVGLKGFSRLFQDSWGLSGFKPVGHPGCKWRVSPLSKRLDDLEKIVANARGCHGILPSVQTCTDLPDAWQIGTMLLGSAWHEHLSQSQRRRWNFLDFTGKIEKGSIQQSNSESGRLSSDNRSARGVGAPFAPFHPLTRNGCGDLK